MPSFSVVQTHEQGRTPLDPVVRCHVSRLKVNANDKGSSVCAACSVGIVVAGTGVHACADEKGAESELRSCRVQKTCKSREWGLKG